MTFRLRSHLIRLVEAVAERDGVDRSTIIEAWVKGKLEDEYPGCTGVTNKRRAS